MASKKKSEPKGKAAGGKATAGSKRPAGRPTEYVKKYDNVTFKLALLGKNDVEIAAILGVSQQTLNAWKKKHPTFLESLKKGKDLADAEVAESLYMRAKGFSDQEGKYHPPDTMAACVWLNNRQAKFWRKSRDKEPNEAAGASSTATNPFHFNMLPPSNPDLAKPPEDLGDDYKGGRVDTDYRDPDPGDDDGQ